MKSLRRTLSKHRGKSQQPSGEVSIPADATSAVADAAAQAGNTQIAGQLLETPRGRAPQRGKLQRGRRGDLSTSPMKKRNFYQLPSSKAPFPNSIPLSVEAY